VPRCGRRGRGRAPVGDLTDREREIAELAGRGHTNREIATQLFLSIRTVNNHLNHVYTKLGFNDRDQLATALDLRRPTEQPPTHDGEGHRP
jgi:DNA-binding CsgD family transcriptional regulator